MGKKGGEKRSDGYVGGNMIFFKNSIPHATSPLLAGTLLESIADNSNRVQLRMTIVWKSTEWTKEWYLEKEKSRIRVFQ